MWIAVGRELAGGLATELALVIVGMGYVWQEGTQRVR